jgi:hypothetical protein
MLETHVADPKTNGGALILHGKLVAREPERFGEMI